VRVRKMIAGDDEPRGIAWDSSNARMGAYFREIVSDQVPADVRLANLVKYLESIQQK
jgi:hypothetical protein